MGMEWVEGYMRVRGQDGRNGEGPFFLCSIETLNKVNTSE